MKFSPLHINIFTDTAVVPVTFMQPFLGDTVQSICSEVRTCGLPFSSDLTELKMSLKWALQKHF